MKEWCMVVYGFGVNLCVWFWKNGVWFWRNGFGGMVLEEGHTITHLNDLTSLHRVLSLISMTSLVYTEFYHSSQ